MDTKECEAPAFDPSFTPMKDRDLLPVRERTAIAAAPPKPRRWSVKQIFRNTDIDDAQERRLGEERKREACYMHERRACLHNCDASHADNLVLGGLKLVSCCRRCV
jgi:hypothetical protein